VVDDQIGYEALKIMFMIAKGCKEGGDFLVKTVREGGYSLIKGLQEKGA